MDEIYSDVTKPAPKPFFASALILEGIAVLLLIATLLSLRFLTPKFFKELKAFYTENICYNAVVDEGKN